MTKVLVIDDEAPIRLLCRVNLEAEGIDVVEAPDGPAGIERAKEERPDVILLDVMMPGLDGWRVAEQLLEDDRTNGIPIIFLTARAEFRDRAKGLDIGGGGYTTTPLSSRRTPAGSKTARGGGLASHWLTTQDALIGPQARSSPKTGPAAPEARTREVNAPWEKYWCRSMSDEWERATRTRR